MAVVGFPSQFSFNLNNRSSSTEMNLELPYIAQVYSSSSLKRSPIPQAFPRRASGLVNLGSFSKVLIGRICPLPLKALVVSHPQNACKARRLHDIQVYLLLLPLSYWSVFCVFLNPCQKGQSFPQAYQYTVTEWRKCHCLGSNMDNLIALILSV